MNLIYDTDNNKYLTLVLLFTAILFLNYRSIGHSGAILFLLDTIILLFYWQRNRDIVRFTTASKSLLVLFAYEIIITLVTYGMNPPELSFNSLLTKNLIMLIAIIFCCAEYDGEKVMIGIRNIGIALSIIGVYEFITHNGIFYSLVSNENKQFFASSFGSGSARVRTIFLHPIICGVYSVVILTILLYYPLKNRFGNMIAYLAVIISLVGTQSRSSILSFVIVMLLHIISNADKRYIEKDRIIFAAMVFVVVLPFIVMSVNVILEAIEPVTNRLIRGFTYSKASNNARIAAIYNDISIYLNDYSVLEKLIGRGYGTAYHILKLNPIFGYWNDAVDNQFITYLMDIGLIGLITNFVFIGSCFMCYLRSETAFGKAKYLSVLSMCISSFFYEMFSWEIVTFLLFLIVALPESIYRSNDEFDFGAVE